mmetsp:Transcript_7243/g.27109  ORF Transcript_7243/g.27109 Transcript_7243/m.27109 type:complete len:488 (+) Transcript_7243:392-1855(+)
MQPLTCIFSCILQPTHIMNGFSKSPLSSSTNSSHEDFSFTICVRLFCLFYYHCVPLHTASLPINRTCSLAIAAAAAAWKFAASHPLSPPRPPTQMTSLPSLISQGTNTDASLASQDQTPAASDQTDSSQRRKGSNSAKKKRRSTNLSQQKRSPSSMPKVSKKTNTLSTSPHVNNNWRRVNSGGKLNTLQASRDLEAEFYYYGGENAAKDEPAALIDPPRQPPPSVLNVTYNKSLKPRMTSLQAGDSSSDVLRAPLDLHDAEMTPWDSPSQVKRRTLSPMAQSPQTGAKTAVSVGTEHKTVTTTTHEMESLAFNNEHDVSPSKLTFIPRSAFQQMTESQKYSAYLRAMTLLSRQPLVQPPTRAVASEASAQDKEESSQSDDVLRKAPATQHSNSAIKDSISSVTPTPHITSPATTQVDVEHQQKKQDYENKMLQQDVELLRMRLVEREKELERVKSFLNKYVDNPFGNPFFEGVKSTSVTLSSGLIAR